MNLLMPLASLLGFEARGMVSRLRSLAVVYTIVALLCLLGLGFLIAAGFMALADIVGALNAALILGGTFLLLALAVYLGSRIGEGRHRRRLAEKRRSGEAGAFLTTAALTALPMLMRSPLIVRLGLPAAALATLVLLHEAEDDED